MAGRSALDREIPVQVGVWEPSGDAIRARFAELKNYRSVAREFGISDPMVHRIVKGTRLSLHPEFTVK